MSVLRRVYKQGSSAVVSIPKWMLELADVSIGDAVIVEWNKGGWIVIMAFKEPTVGEPS